MSQAEIERFALVPTDMPVFHVFERSANGRMQSIAGFLTRAEALEAAGLSE